MEEERREKRRPLGEIVQALRVNKKGVVDFSEGGLAFAVRLPEQQIEVIGKLLSESSTENLFFWIYKTKQSDITPWQGVVIAGPFEEMIEKDVSLLDRRQKERWFNQFLTPFDEISYVGEIDITDEVSFKVSGGREVSFKTIREALKSALESEKGRTKDGEGRERQYQREMRSQLPKRGVPGEAARRHVKIGKD